MTGQFDGLAGLETIRNFQESPRHAEIAADEWQPPVPPGKSAASYSECDGRAPVPAGELQDVLHIGSNLLHRVDEIANFTPNNSLLTPADYDRVFGTGEAEKMAKFGIKSIERQGSSFKIGLEHTIVDGDQQGWVSIGENDVVGFSVAQQGVQTEISNLSGVTAHGAGGLINIPVTGFNLDALEGSYLKGQLISSFQSQDLCVTPDHGIGTNEAGTNKAVTNKAITNKAGTNKAGTDKAGTDKAGTDKAGTDKGGTDFWVGKR